jgi:hypothetical protein
MFTPPTNTTRMFVTAWPKTGGIHMVGSAETFEQFFREISADEARRRLGPDGEERLLDETGAREFNAGLERLLHPTTPREASAAPAPP